MKPQLIYGKTILNSRKEKTIEISVKCESGIFSASAPSGKSKGSNEKKEFVNNIENDIKTISELSHKICKIDINKFRDLVEIEEIVKGKVGANTLYALEVSLLKASAAEQGKELWQFLNENARKMPKPIGNCIGGGVHTPLEIKPEFQEFLVIPKTENFSDCVFIMKKVHERIGEIIKDRRIKNLLNDENAWAMPVTNIEALELLNKIRDDVEIESGCKIEVGIDIAASTFYNKKDGNYVYKEKRLNKDEQIDYITSLKEKFDIYYIEDPLHEEDFKGFSELRKRIIGGIVVGDDLTVTNHERVKKALDNGSVDAIIIKPNQCGSLIEVSKVLKIAKENNIKTVFSHRSGETLDYSLADLAFAAQCDFIKTGIIGKEREIKLKRLINIEKELFG